MPAHRRTFRKSTAGLAFAVALITVVIAPATALGASDPNQGRAFEPTPMSEPRYGVSPPSANPALQQHHVTAVDGARIYVETYLPAARDGVVPPRRVPTILVMTPYANPATFTVFGHDAFARYFAMHGYAVSIGHVRGTGRSDGCIEVGGPLEVDATARVVEYLGRDAPWTNKRVGMYGGSYAGMTQIGVATLGPRRATRYLKAIVPIAPVTSWFENAAHDGVPTTPGITLGFGLYNAGFATAPTAPPDPTAYPGRYACADEAFAEAWELDQTGDVGDYWQERDYRRAADRIRAATLLVHGLRDVDAPTLNLSGLLERFPDDVPFKRIFGQWGHADPEAPPGHPVFPMFPRRADWVEMVHAWFDRYLLGLETGVETWPDVQVQDTNRQWRAETTWPGVEGMLGQLALGSSELGTTEPSGDTAYEEASVDGAPGTAVFTTDRLSGELRVTGQPVLDLWLELDQPDAHVAVSLEAFDEAGEQIARIYGARSARHLDPLVDNWFHQADGRPAPTNEAVRIPVRLVHTDFVVPVGGYLRVTVSGSTASINGFQTAPSGASGTVSILHDCRHTSALRFRMPSETPDLLNIRDLTETGPLPETPSPEWEVDGDGVATHPVCGQDPIDPQIATAHP